MSNSVHSFLFTQETRLNNYINQLLQQSTRAFSITSSVARQNKFNRENNKEHTISNLRIVTLLTKVGFCNPPLPPLPPSPFPYWLSTYIKLVPSFLFIYLCLLCIFFFKIECLLRGTTFLYMDCYDSSVYSRLLYFGRLNPESPP